MAESAVLTTALKPFGLDHETRYVQSGRTVEDILLTLPMAEPWVTISVVLNGIPVVRNRWKSRVVSEGDHLLVRYCPAGGSDASKRKTSQMLMMAVQLGAVMFAPGLGNLALTGLTKGGFYAGAWSIKAATVASFAAMSWAGKHAVSQLVPLHDPEKEPTFNASFGGASNAITEFGAWPRLFGRMRIFPKYAAQPYVEWNGTKSWHVMMFAISYAPVNIETDSVKIGDTPLSSIDAFDPVHDMEIRQGWSWDETPRRLYAQQVFDKSVGATIDHNGQGHPEGWEVPTSYRTSANVDAIDIIINYPSGYVYYVDDSPRTLRCTYQVKMAPGPLFSVFKTVKDGTGYNDDAVWTLSTLQKKPYTMTVRVTRAMIDETWPEYTDIDNTGFQVKLIVRYIGGTGSGSDYRNLETDGSAWPVWTTLRSMHAEDPVLIDKVSRFGTNAKQYATMTLRIPSEYVGNSASGNVSVIASAMFPAWTGSGWTSPSADNASNPGWAYASVLRDDAGALDIDSDLIDNDRILEFADDCTEKGYTFNYYCDTFRSVRDLAKLILSCGRAFYGENDGKISVVMDRPQTVAVCTFASRTCSNYRARRMFTEAPHAIRSKFKNSLYDWVDDEIVVYRDGYSMAGGDGNLPARYVEEMECHGLDTYEAVYKHVRYQMKCEQQRAVLTTFETGPQWIGCQRGNLIGVNFDDALYGITSARIVSVIKDESLDYSGIIVDNGFPMEVLGNYGVRITLTNAGHVGEEIQLDVYNPGEDTWTQILFVDPIEHDAEAFPQVGDLVVFGNRSEERVLLTVKEIVPNSRLGAEITGVLHAPEVHDEGPIPEYESCVTRPPNQRNYPPPKPIISSVKSDESVMERASDGTLISCIAISLSYETHQQRGEVRWTEVQYRHHSEDMAYAWERVPAFDGMPAWVTIANVDDGAEYDLRVRTISTHHVPGDWVGYGPMTVIGKTSLPPDVENVYVEDHQLVRWTYPSPPLDLAGFHLRYHTGPSDTWDDAIAAHDGLIAKPEFPMMALPSNSTLTILVKAVDTGGRESENAAKIQFDTAPLNMDYVDSTLWPLLIPSQFVSVDSEWDRIGTIVSGVVLNDPMDPLDGCLVGEELGSGWSNPIWPDDMGQPIWPANMSDPFWPVGERYGPVEYLFTTGETMSLKNLLDGDGIDKFLHLGFTAYGDVHVSYTRTEYPTYQWDIPFPARLPLKPFVDGYDNLYVRVKIPQSMAVRPALEEIGLTVEAAWVTETVTDIPVLSSGDTTVPLSKTYDRIIDVTPVICDETTAGTDLAFVRVTGKSTSGPTIRGYDKDGSQTDGIVDVKVRGI
jgi:sulfur carrier protein ThiS